MIRWEFDKAIASLYLTHKLVGGLIMAQAIMGCYLLAFDHASIALFTVLCGVPIAWLFVFIFQRGSTHYHIQMAIVMFSVGGFGMILGCSLDMGRYSLLSLMSMCRSIPLPLFPSPDLVWQKMQLTPWTYIGMFVGSNLGMLLIQELRPQANRGRLKMLVIYAVCNVGMLMGMLIGEALAVRFAADMDQYIAAVVMLASMSLGMTLGMVALLILTNRLHHMYIVPKFH